MLRHLTGVIAGLQRRMCSSLSALQLNMSELRECGVGQLVGGGLL